MVQEKEINLKRAWTPEEDEVIRVWGPKISLQRLAVRMKRSKFAVRARAKALAVPIVNLPRLSLEEREDWR